jgi:hypothetical protein
MDTPGQHVRAYNYDQARAATYTPHSIPARGRVARFREGAARCLLGDDSKGLPMDVPGAAPAASVPRVSHRATGCSIRPSAAPGGRLTA